MGTYTEFRVNLHVADTAPPHVHQMLTTLVDLGWEAFNNLLASSSNYSHAFFACERANSIFANGTASGDWYASYADNVLSAHSVLKNYDDEIGKFADWIAEHIDLQHPYRMEQRSEDWEDYEDYPSGPMSMYTPSKVSTQGWRRVGRHITEIEAPVNPYVGKSNNLTFAWARGFDGKKRNADPTSAFGRAYIAGKEARKAFEKAQDDNKQ